MQNRQELDNALDTLRDGDFGTTSSATIDSREIAITWSATILHGGDYSAALTIDGAESGNFTFSEFLRMSCGESDYTEFTEAELETLKSGEYNEDLQNKADINEAIWGLYYDFWYDEVMERVEEELAEHGIIEARKPVTPEQQHKDCAAAIDAELSAVRTPGEIAGTATYDLKTALANLNSKFGSDCVLIVLAAIVVKNNYDGRYSSANKAWAETFDSAEIENVRHNTRYCTVKTHPVVLDGLVNNARLAAQEVIPPKTKLLGQLNDNLAKVKKVKAEQIKKPGQKKRKVTEVE